ncbi:MAG TPA: FAD-binding oxidoreductase [Acidimicrobiales bacterium]|nr:FAD-binding oxidoreductase [Acidimicrobiales bacterium]
MRGVERPALRAAGRLRRRRSRRRRPGGRRRGDPPLSALPTTGPALPGTAAGRREAALADHRRRLDALVAQYRAIPAGEPVRLAKRTSNLFRARDRATTPGLDVAAFDGVLWVDPDARVAEVGGMTTYEHLVDATLPHGLMPLVVPQLKTITLGGAVTGLGIESSSWRAGMPHESVLELEVLTGAGAVEVLHPGDGLFQAFPNSYGTLGYTTRLRIELAQVEPWVHLRHERFASVAALADRIAEVCAPGATEADFVDGVVFSPEECYLTLASFATSLPAGVTPSDYTGTEIFYRSIPARSDDWLSVRDYLWRWDTDWFWCSRAFGVQRRWVRRLLGPRWLRSDTYWKIKALEDRHHLKARLDARRGLPPREDVVQDVEVPLDRLAELMAGFAREVPISPVWLCPLRQRDPSASWPLYSMRPDELYVNVGFWSTCALAPGMDPAHHNRWVEAEVGRLGGRKSLYSTAFYDEPTFWSLYGAEAYWAAKRAADPDGRLLDLYAKCVRGR